MVHHDGRFGNECSLLSRRVGENPMGKVDGTGGKGSRECVMVDLEIKVCCFLQ